MGAIMKPSLKLPYNRNFLASIKRRIWVAGYKIEESRQLFSSGGHLWKEAATCVVLALLRTGRLA